MKKLLATLFGLILIILVVPNFIDWSHFKEPITNLVKDQTGFELDVKGPLKLQLFPTLHLSAKNVSIKNQPGFKAEHLVTLKSLNFKADLLSLLKGKLNVSQIELIEPMIYLETQKDGVKNWDRPSEVKKDQESQQNQANSNAKVDFQIDTIKIEKGYLSHSDGQSAKEIRDIHMNGSLSALTGPFDMQGSLIYEEYALKGSVRSPQSFKDGAAPIQAEVSIRKGKQDVGTLTLNGEVKGETYAGDLKANLTNLPEAIQEITKDGNLSFSAKAEGSRENIQLKKVNVHTSGVQGSGEASILINGDKPIIKANIVIPTLNLKATTAKDSPSQNQPSQGASSRSSERFSKESWHIDLPKDFNLDLSMHIQTLRYDIHTLSQVKSHIVLQNGNLRIADLSAQLYKGSLKGSATITPQKGTTQIMSALDLNGIDLAALPNAGQSALKKALLSASLKVNTTANSMAEAISRLSGSAHLNVTNGVIEAFNVKNFVNHVKQVKGPQDIPSLVQDVKTKAPLAFSYLKGDFSIQNGKAQTNNLAFDAEDVSATGVGLIDLPAWQTNMNLKVKLKDLPKIPEIGVHISGDLSQPHFSLDQDMLAKVLLTKAVEGVVKQAIKGIDAGPLGNVIQGALGMNKKEQQAKPQDNSKSKENKIDPGKIIKGIFG